MKSKRKQSAEQAVQAGTSGSLPAAGTRRKLEKEFFAELLKTFAFALAAVTALVTGCIAWFVSNSQVRSGTSPISAGFEPIKLATTGNRQEADKYLKLPDGNTLQIGDKTYYYTEGDTIALRLSGTDYEVSPGARGMVEFYVIPGSGTPTVTLQIGLGGYGAKDNDPDHVLPINDPALNALISGHILLFDDYDAETGRYSNWLFQGSGSGIFSNTITVDLSTTTVGVPVDFYWVWPLRYENLASILAGKSFVDDQAGSGAMTDLPLNYRYSRVYLTDQADLSKAAARSKAYDLADEYIGSNAQYLYLTIQTIASEEGEGGQQP